MIPKNRNLDALVSSLTLTNAFDDEENKEFSDSVSDLYSVIGLNDEEEDNEEDINLLRTILDTYKFDELIPIRKAFIEAYGEGDTPVEKPKSLIENIKNFVGKNINESKVLDASIHFGLSESKIFMALFEAEGDVENATPEENIDGEAPLPAEVSGYSGEQEEIVPEEGLQTEEELDQEINDAEIASLLSNLDQVEININKINGLEADDELKGIYLQEFGKKYLIEEKLTELGYVFPDVEASVMGDIFESKMIDKDCYVDIKKSKSSFTGLVKMYEADELFEKIMIKNVVGCLSEGHNVHIPHSNGVMCLTSHKDKAFAQFKINGADAEIPSGLCEGSEKYQTMAILKEDEVHDMVKNIISGTLFENYNKVLSVGNMYVSMSGDHKYDLVDDISEATVFDDVNIITNVMTDLNETYMWGVSISDTIAVENVSYYKLFEEYSYGGRIIGKAGSLVVKDENGFSFGTTDNTDITIRNNQLFEEKLIKISHTEYILSLSENAIPKLNKKFLMFSNLFENEGYELTYKKWFDVDNLYEGYVAKSPTNEILLTKPSVSGNARSDYETLYSKNAASELFEMKQSIISDHFDKMLGIGIESIDNTKYEI